MLLSKIVLYNLNKIFKYCYYNTSTRGARCRHIDLQVDSAARKIRPHRRALQLQRNFNLNSCLFKLFCVFSKFD